VLTRALMSPTTLAVLAGALAFEGVVLLLGGLLSGSWRGLEWMAVLAGAWLVAMMLGGSTPARNRLGLATVAALGAYYAAKQIAAWASV
jgi:hypothetical protein